MSLSLKLFACREHQEQADSRIRFRGSLPSQFPALLFLCWFSAILWYTKLYSKPAALYIVCKRSGGGGNSSIEYKGFNRPNIEQTVSALCQNLGFPFVRLERRFTEG